MRVRWQAGGQPAVVVDSPGEDLIALVDAWLKVMAVVRNVPFSSTVTADPARGKPGLKWREKRETADAVESDRNNNRSKIAVM